MADYNFSEGDYVQFWITPNADRKFIGTAEIDDWGIQYFLNPDSAYSSKSLIKILKNTGINQWHGAPIPVTAIPLNGSVKNLEVQKITAKEYFYHKLKMKE